MRLSEDIIIKVKSFIAQDLAEDALALLLTETKEANEIILLKQRLTRLNRQKDHGVKSNTDYKLDLNEIMLAILNYASNPTVEDDSQGNRASTKQDNTSSGSTFNFNNHNSKDCNITQGNNTIYLE